MNTSLMFYGVPSGIFFGLLRNSTRFPMEFRWLFSQFFKKKSQSSKKIFFVEDLDFHFHSVTTHTIYMIKIYYHWILFLLQFFDGKSMCNSSFVCFYLPKIIVHCNKFPNLGVYRANFPELLLKIWIFIFIQSPHTRSTWLKSTTIESYFSFNFLMAKVCVIAHLFVFIYQK